MGLDMYLTASKFISAYSDKNKPLLKKLEKVFPEMKSFKLENVKFSVGYWRKANQIHKWFVDNVQYGEDKCREHSVSKEKLIELRDLCKKVLKNRTLAKTKLPTSEGFFFGGNEYDEFYFKDLEDTIKIIDKIIKEINLEEYDIEYCSSW